MSSFGHCDCFQDGARGLNHGLSDIDTILNRCDCAGGRGRCELNNNHVVVVVDYIAIVDVVIDCPCVLKYCGLSQGQGLN